ncbi:hypothetical protein [Streptomyces sp. NPDC050416]|uniref:hypothetical protein n=1 Tax=Streptomyces sp. NPDC050416 TaxID=3365611 RepID=UPI0037BA6154
MDIYQVETVEATTTAQGTPIWMVSMRKPDGSIHAHTFPPSTIEWRMAEYGLDSVDEALDIILHEPWATDPTDPIAGREDPAVRAGMTVLQAGAATAEPIRLHNAPTIADAREAHRLRIADAKTRIRITPPKGKQDPLDIIRQQHGVTGEGLRQKAALVDSVRRAMRGEPAPRNADIVIDPEAHTRTVKETSRA